MKNGNNIPFLDLPHDENKYGGRFPSIFAHERSAKFEERNPQLLFDCCLIDQVGRQFACIHAHCQAQSNCFKDGQLQSNLDFHELQFHPEDRKLWCEKTFPDILRFLDSEPVVDLPEYRFIFNHRYIHLDGSISQFMHEGTFIFAGDQSLPVLRLKVFSEIADIKADESIILTIFRYSAQQGYQKVFTKVYANTLDSPLSHREMEIVRLCHEGLSSKMIAEKLNLSIHTVKNHKRKSMEKTLTHNITELIHLCLLNHWL